MKHSLFNIRLFFMDVARLLCAVLLPIFRITRVTPEGKKYKGRVRGGAIIAANHTSFADPFLVGVTFWYRRTYFLVAEVVMRNKLVAWLLRGVGAIRIDRNKVDIDAINKSVDKLKHGYLLTMFPQGGITHREQIDSVKSGAILMAMRAGVPIVPIHIMPRDKWYKCKVVVVGEPIDPAKLCTKKMPSTADIKMITDRLVQEMNRCRNYNTEKVTE